MQNVVALAATAAACLLTAQAALVLVRARSCVRRSVPALLALFLLATSIHLWLPRGSALEELVGPLILWAAGAFLIRATRRGALRAWTGAVLAFLCSLAIARALGPSDSIPREALRSFGTVVLVAAPLGIT